MSAPKTKLQLRAETAAKKFKTSARKPIVIEFAGLPKAGKTTTINHVQSFLRRCGFRVEIVVERASVCPIRDKKHSNFNVWTACTTLSQVLEKTQTPPGSGDPDIIILDRGIFDALLWFTMMERLARIRKRDRKRVEEFFLIDDWRSRITGVVLMTASPKDAMKREKGYLPVADVEGSIMNVDVLGQMRNVFDKTIDRFKDKFRILRVDTSYGETRNNPSRTCEIVAENILSWIEDQLQEDILFLSKEKISDLFSGKSSISGEEAERLSNLFWKEGEFAPREEVEKDEKSVQALPIVIVRNKSGDVLRLRRREKNKKNPLHKKIVLWAGGHVRKEDKRNGNPLILCAQRELQEELRLSIEPDRLRLMGGVYLDEAKRISKHVALVYEWRAETDDVAIVLSRSEFFERRGTSLSGSFVKLDQLIQDVEEEKVTEGWSAEIVRSILAADSKGVTGSLFN